MVVNGGALEVSEGDSTLVVVGQARAYLISNDSALCPVCLPDALSPQFTAGTV